MTTGSSQTATTQSKFAYFSAADGAFEKLNQAAGLTQSNDFDWALLHNILFIQEPTVIPDIFFFISKSLKDHILNPRQTGHSLLETAMAKKQVIGAFRTQMSYRDAYTGFKKTIVGVLDREEELAIRLDRAAPDVPSHEIWKGNGGDEYKKAMRAMLVSPADAPLILQNSTAQDELNQMWKDKRPFWVDCIEEAIRSTESQFGDASGLRHGELTKTVARKLGFATDDMAELLQIIDRRKNPLLWGEIEQFLRWSRECYNWSRAKLVDSMPSFPAYSKFSGVVAAPHLKPPQKKETSESLFHPFIIPARIPSVTCFLKADPKKIFETRDEKGVGYFAAYEAWRDAPDDPDKRRRLEERLTTYCKALTALGQTHAAITFTFGVSPLTVQLLRAVGSAALVGAGAIAATPGIDDTLKIIGTGGLILLGNELTKSTIRLTDLVCSAVSWKRGRTKKIKVRLPNVNVLPPSQQ